MLDHHNIFEKNVELLINESFYYVSDNTLSLRLTIHSRLGQPVSGFVVKCPHAWLNNLS